jgi:hypothetical protein
MIAAAIYILLLAVQATTPSTASQTENKDLDLIPGVAQQQEPPDPKRPINNSASLRIYIENAVILSAQRKTLIVPAPLPVAPGWQERLFMDIRKDWSLSNRLTMTVSDRFNFRAEDNISFPSGHNVINDFREGFLSWEPVDRTYFDAGRINLKSGAALGLQPDRFFQNACCCRSAVGRSIRPARGPGGNLDAQNSTYLAKSRYNRGVRAQTLPVERHLHGCQFAQLQSFLRSNERG